MCCNPMNTMLRRIVFHRGGLGERPNVLQFHEFHAAAHCSTAMVDGGIQNLRICCNPMNPMLRHTLSHRGGGDGESRICCNPMNPMLRRILSHRAEGRGAG